MCANPQMKCHPTRGEPVSQTTNVIPAPGRFSCFFRRTRLCQPPNGAAKAGAIFIPSAAQAERIAVTRIDHPATPPGPPPVPRPASSVEGSSWPATAAQPAEDPRRRRVGPPHLAVTAPQSQQISSVMNGRTGAKQFAKISKKNRARPPQCHPWHGSLGPFWAPASSLTPKPSKHRLLASFRDTSPQYNVQNEAISPEPKGRRRLKRISLDSLR